MLSNSKFKAQGDVDHLVFIFILQPDMEIMLWGSAGTGLRLLMVPQFARLTTTLTFNEKAILMNLLLLLLSSEEI